LIRLAPADEELARDELAEKLGVPRVDIKNIRVLDWITGEMLITFHGGKPQTAFLDPAIPAD
jgi:hypothetical protein